MQLSEFIHKYRIHIIKEWERFALTLSPASNLTKLQLRDHIEEILEFIAKDIDTAQSHSEQIKKSHGESDSQNVEDSAAETHGDLRQEEGFDLVEMISEYRALRTSIIKLWTESQGVLTNEDVSDLVRFNESIDQALAESVARFTEPPLAA